MSDNIIGDIIKYIMDIKFDRYDLEKYSRDELIYFFNKYWFSSTKYFSKKYHIDFNSFNDFLVNGIESEISLLAIKAFLYTIWDYFDMRSYFDRNDPNHYDEKLKCILDLDSKLVSEDKIRSFEYSYQMSVDYMEKVVVAPNDIINVIMSKKLLSTVIFVDTVIADVERLALHDDLTVHIIIFISNREVIPVSTQIAVSKPGISIMKSGVNSEMMMNSVSSALNVVIDKNISFILVSGDKFVEGLSMALRLVVVERDVVCGTIDELLNV